MRIVYVGCKFIGYECLKHLFKKDENVVSVYTLHPDLKDKTAGFKSFDPLMGDKDIQYYKIKDINENEVVKNIKEENPDIIIQVGWSQIIKEEIINLPPKGTVGFHASPLPKFRGGAPVNWAIIKGKKEWATTFFYMDTDVDSGDIIGQKKLNIDFEDTVKDVYEKVTLKDIELLEEYLPLLKEGEAPRKPQDDSEATYVERRKPEDGVIDWTKSSYEIYNWIRALTHPYPGAFTFYDGKKVLIWDSKASEKESHRKPGTIVNMSSEGIEVSTSDGILVLTRLQMEGQKELTFKEWVKKYNIKEGENFENRR